MTQETDPKNPLMDEKPLPYLRDSQGAMPTIFNIYIFVLIMCIAGWVCINLTQAGIFREEGAPIEKMPP